MFFFIAILYLNKNNIYDFLYLEEVWFSTDFSYYFPNPKQHSSHSFNQLNCLLLNLWSSKTWASLCLFINWSQSLDKMNANQQTNLRENRYKRIKRKNHCSLISIYWNCWRSCCSISWVSFGFISLNKEEKDTIFKWSI